MSEDRHDNDHGKGHFDHGNGNGYGHYKPRDKPDDKPEDCEVDQPEPEDCDPEPVVCDPDPGPKGDPGTDGTNGTDGKDGVDGVTTVVYVNTTTTVVDDRSGPVIVTPPMETGVGNHIFGTRKADVIDHNWFVPVTEFDDVIFGRKGSDTIYGLDGNDTICGDTGFAGHKKGGNDTIIGGKGDDHIWGGPGRDTFIFNTGDGDDIIRFTKKDTLDLSGTDVSSYSELKDLMSKAGDGVMIDFHNGDSVFLGKTKMSSLHSNDFDF